MYWNQTLYSSLLDASCPNSYDYGSCVQITYGTRGKLSTILGSQGKKDEKIGKEKFCLFNIIDQKYTPRVAAGIANQWIAQYDDVDNKMPMCLADLGIAVACASGF